MTKELKPPKGFFWDNKYFPVDTVLPMLPHSERCFGDKAIVKRKELDDAETLFYLACLECAEEGVMLAPIPPSTRSSNPRRR